MFANPFLQKKFATMYVYGLIYTKLQGCFYALNSFQPERLHLSLQRFTFQRKLLQTVHLKVTCDPEINFFYDNRH